MSVNKRKNYRVVLTETIQYITQVRARSAESALEIAKQMAEENVFPDEDQDLLESKVSVQSEEGDDEAEAYIVG